MLLRGLPSMGTWGCVWGLFRLVHFAVAQLWQAENADRPEQGAQTAPNKGCTSTD